MTDSNPQPEIPPPPTLLPMLPPPVEPRPRRNPFWNALAGCFVLLTVVVILIFLAPTLIGVNVVASVVDIARSLVNPPTTARVDSRGTIISGIQSIGQLVSISVQMAEPEINVGVQQGGLNACGFLATHVAEGTIEGGMDMTQITDDSIEYDAATETYTIHLPAPQLTSCRIDYIRQYNRSTTVCNVDWDGARVIANYKALNNFRDDALEGGILQRAEVEARLVIGNFVGALTGSRVNIEFAETETTAVPSSCVPPVPEGWTYLEATDEWVKAP